MHALMRRAKYAKMLSPTHRRSAHTYQADRQKKKSGSEEYVERKWIEMDLAQLHSPRYPSDRLSTLRQTAIYASVELLE